MKLTFFPQFIDSSLTHKTYFGAIITLLMIFVAFILSFGEINSFLHPQIKEQLVAATNLRSSLNETTISFSFVLTIPCHLLHLDVFDMATHKPSETLFTLNKTRLNLNDVPFSISPEVPQCGDCYGAQSPQKQCCNSCSELIEAYQSKGWLINQMANWSQCQNEKISFTGQEKCLLDGVVTTSTWLQGGFHIAPGINVYVNRFHKHDYSPIEEFLNLSHEIKKLQFGSMKKSPLDETIFIQNDFNPVHYRYQLNAVPYVVHGKKKQKGFKYTVNFAVIPVNNESRFGPGLFFVYNFAPVAIVAAPEKVSIFVLISRIVSIIGGTFMLGRLIDTFEYRIHTFEGKQEIGKAE